MTIASLGVEVDSSQASKGVVNLDALTASAGRAEAATVQLGARASTALKNTSFQTANIAAQFNDIAVQLSSGQSPFLIALQQGTQLAPALGEGKGLAGTLGLLKAGFMSMLSPVSLLTIGVIAFGGFAVQAIGAIVPKTESATDALKRHETQLKALVAGYKGAAAAVDDFATAAETLPASIVQQGIAQQFEEMKRKAEDFGASMHDGQFSLFGGTTLETYKGLAGSLNAIDQQVGKLGVDFGSGKITIDEFAAGMDRVSRMNFFDPLNSMHQLVLNARDAALAVGNLETAYVNLEHATADTGHNQGLQVILDSQNEALRAGKAQQIELDAINAKTPAQLADIARRREALDLADQQISDSLRQQKIDAAGALAAAQARHAITEADKARLRAANDNVAAAQAELDAVGKTAWEASKLQFIQQQMAGAKDEAAQRGGTVSPAVVAGIKRAAEEMEMLQEKIAGAQLVIADEGPWAAMQREIEKTGDLLADHAIDWDTYAKEVGKAAEKMVDSFANGADNLLGSFQTIAEAQDTSGQEMIARQQDAFDQQVAAGTLSGQAQIDAQKQLNQQIDAEGQRSFELNKELSIARAVVAGAESVVHSYNAGTEIGGPVVGAIFAGVAAAATGAQIAAISSTTYHSKTANAAAGSGGMGAAAAASTSSPASITVQLPPGSKPTDNYTRDQAIGMMKAITSAYGDGSKITFKAA